MRYLFIILWLFVVVSGKLTVRIQRDHDSDEPSEAIDDGKTVDGIDSGIGESETLDDHNDEVETEEKDSMSGIENEKDSINPSSLSGNVDQNQLSIEDSLASSTEQNDGDSLKIDEDQRDEQNEEIEISKEVREDNSDGQSLEFKPESPESVPLDELDAEQDLEQVHEQNSEPLDGDLSIENTDESNEESIQIAENPALAVQSDESDQPVEQSVEQPTEKPAEQPTEQPAEQPVTSPITPVSNQDQPDLSTDENNQDFSNSSNTTQQTNTSTIITKTSTTITTSTSLSSTIISTSTEDAAFEEEMRESIIEEPPPATQPIETKVEENTRGRGTVLFFLLLISGAIVFFIFKWRMNRRNDPNRYISTAATFNNPVSFPDMNYHDDPL